MVRSPVASILVLALLAVGAKQEDASGSPAGAKVRVLRLDADPVEGTFVRADATGILLDGQSSPLSPSSVRELRFGADTPPRPLEGGTVGLRVVLRGGEVVRGTLETATAEELTVKPPDFGSMRIPFDSIRRVETESPRRGPCDEPGSEFPPRKGADLAYSRSGDAFSGTLAEANVKGIVLEGNGTKQSLPWTDLVVLHLDGDELPPEKGVVVEIDTTGGSVLLASEATGDASEWKLLLRTGLRLTLPKDALIAVRWSGGAFARLESLPFESTFTSYYKDDALRPYLEVLYGGTRVDRTPKGCPLRIANVTYRHGISVHAKNVVRVALGKAFRRFSCAFGVDDGSVEGGLATASKGDVTARVLVDGKEAWSSKGSVKGGAAAVTIGPLDVSGAEELLLEVGFGDDQYMLDRANWVDPILVR